MSIPLTCPKCHELIGVHQGFLGFIDPSILTAGMSCPSKGKHQLSIRRQEKKLFGLLQHVSTEFPETNTYSSWDEYTGPKQTFFIWLAIVFSSNKSVLINDKWCWWNFSIGFFGDGAKELQRG